jgi:hypothetical protein
MTKCYKLGDLDNKNLLLKLWGKKVQNKGGGHLISF